jgi:hypothetical protein
VHYNRPLAMVLTVCSGLAGYESAYPKDTGPGTPKWKAPVRSSYNLVSKSFANLITLLQEQIPTNEVSRKYRREVSTKADIWTTGMGLVCLDA